MQDTFQIVDVEARHVDVNSRADDRNGVLFVDFQRMQVGIPDDRPKVGLGLLGVAEIHHAVEIEIELVVVNVDLTLETVFLHRAVEHNLINIISQKLSLIRLSVEGDFRVTLLGEKRREISIQVKGANHLGSVSYPSRINGIGLHIAVKHIAINKLVP